MGWFDNAEMPAKPKKGTGRFRLKPGEQTEVTFLDGPVASITVEGKSIEVPTPIKLQEMRYELARAEVERLPQATQAKVQMLLENLGWEAGGWRNFCTVNPDGPDPLSDICRAAAMVFLTVIDHSVWTNYRGEEVTDQIRLFPMKRSSPAWGLLQRQLERRGGDLRGCRYIVERHGDKTSPAVGNAFEFVERREDLTALPAPLDYGIVLAPKPHEDVQKLLDAIHGADAPQKEDQAPSAQWGGWQSSGGSDGGGDDPPF